MKKYFFLVYTLSLFALSSIILQQFTKQPNPNKISVSASTNNQLPPTYLYQKGEIIVRFNQPPMIKTKDKIEISKLTKNKVSISEIDLSTIPPFLSSLINDKRQVKNIRTLFKNTKDIYALEKNRLNNVFIFTYDEQIPVIDLVLEYKKLPEVDFAEPNYLGYPALIPNDPDYSRQWSLTKIGAEEAWNIASGQDITIAVLDTGFDIDHQELVHALLPGYNFTSNPHNTDVRDNTIQPCGHGTHIAGIIAAATNNNIGIAGLAFSAKILPVKVLERYTLNVGCFGSYTDFADGIIYAVDNGSQVINMSLGGTTNSTLLSNAVNYANQKGVVIIAAAGNNNFSDPFYPAYYEPVIAIANTDQNDNRVTSSNYGPWIDLSAPGSSIYSLWPWGNYTSMGGTSCAAPHVSALTAMLLSQRPDLIGKPQEILSILANNADDLGEPGKDNYFGYGRINAAKTLQSLLSPTPTFTPPTAIISTNVKVSFEGRGTNNLRWIEPIIFKVYKTSQPKPFSTSVEITSTTGNFTTNPNFPSIPDIYDFSVKGKHSLSKKISGQFVDYSLTSTIINFGILFEGDINGDDIINDSDLNILSLSLGKIKGQKGYNPQADLNVDGIINYIDRNLLLKNFCKKGDEFSGITECKK